MSSDIDDYSSDYPSTLDDDGDTFSFQTRSKSCSELESEHTDKSNIVIVRRDRHKGLIDIGYENLSEDEERELANLRYFESSLIKRKHLKHRKAQQKFERFESSCIDSRNDGTPLTSQCDLTPFPPQPLRRDHYYPFYKHVIPVDNMATFRPSRRMYMTEKVVCPISGRILFSAR